MSDPFETVGHSPDDPKAPANAAPSKLPRQIGRYRIAKILGEGGFGVVYLGHDDQLSRAVAIKVPRPGRALRSEDVEEYLAEARVLASLDHAHIVPVYDVGTTPDGLCYVVSKFIEGSDLAAKIHRKRPSSLETAELIATVAEALHYAHRKGLVHRDIKPANVLIDTEDKPYVADFGLALKQDDFGTGATFAGTPAYMSPEQARGEGHRVDGRSDIFSLGVVFYEMLVGRRPFLATTQAELFEQISDVEARPPRQVDDRIPKELERICLKALSKRATDRFTTAKDIADDLRHFLSSPQRGDTPSAVERPSEPSPVSNPIGSPTPVFGSTVASDSQQIKIVPKGLRSFDAHDASFFLELLPGPRDRDGLPDSLRFWKTRIEETDADSTFTVGLIYGPSGCGKSSLVKAGLLPRLSNDVIVVYVEATADETEARLLNGLRKRCPSLSPGMPLKETLAALRRGQGIPLGKKVVIVLDQFEQWLHAKKEGQNTELVQALRQCDGVRVQCVVMVRDDFWMAATRFMRELEIRLVEGRNSAAVDLFDMDHAGKVLSAFGRAFGKLPEKHSETTNKQKQFLERAIAGLSQEGKIVSVRLALFAEMMKGKAWTPSNLKAVGGTEGVGIAFLEESFIASTAPPQNRYHAKAAQAVLKELLNHSGTGIRGNIRSDVALLEASGYLNNHFEFFELIRILDQDLRLIAPADSSRIETKSFISVPRPDSVPSAYFQLTHDYLVPSLRDWLTCKQKETRRGRAELMLADRAAAWTARPENRQLPSLWQWLSICCLTAKKTWTPPQRKMMRTATRHHAVRGTIVALLLAFIGWGSREGYGRFEGRRLRDRLLNATTAEVPGIVREMAGYRRWVDPLLHEAFAAAEETKDQRKQLHASLALLPVDVGQTDPLYARLLRGEPQEVVAIREGFRDSKAGVVERLWTLLEGAKADQNERLRAACALAHATPDDPRWKNVSSDVAAALAGQQPFMIGQWADALKPVGNLLLLALPDILADENRSVSERGAIANIYAAYAATSPGACALLENPLSESSQPDDPGEKKLTLGRRKASLAAALLVMKWLLRTWQATKEVADIDKELATGKVEGRRQWYINKQGQTLVEIRDPILVRIDVKGVPTRTVKVGRSYAIASKEVTVEQFRKLMGDDPIIQKSPSPSDDCPVTDVNWYDAVRYCNKLSEREGIPKTEWCYIPIKRGKYGEDMTLAPDAVKRTGYRLPTEMEWWYACRGRSETRYSFGEGENELLKYCWYERNSGDKLHPVGQLKSNDLGLFDVLGNAWEWCHDLDDGADQNPKTRKDDDRILHGDHLLLGGSFNTQASRVSSSWARMVITPIARVDSHGFRLARTLTP